MITRCLTIKGCNLSRETERAAAADPCRQGDIMRLEHPTGDSHAHCLGLVINADCDLQNKKTDGVIAYLPIYTFDEYLDTFWGASYVDEVAGIATNKLLKILNVDEREADDLRAWIRSAPIQTIHEKLAAWPDIKPQQGMISDLLTKLRICVNTDESPLERFGQLCRLEKDPIVAARKQIVAAKKAMGDGHFFISDLVDHEDVGFVIRMRRIYTLPETHCFRSVANQRAGSDGTASTAIRFARLTPLYQFKVAQLFAHQFSRIGLPDDITALSDVAVEILASKLSKVA